MLRLQVAVAMLLDAVKLITELLKLMANTVPILFCHKNKCSINLRDCQGWTEFGIYN